MVCRARADISSSSIPSLLAFSSRNPRSDWVHNSIFLDRVCTGVFFRLSEQHYLGILQALGQDPVHQAVTIPEDLAPGVHIKI